MINQTNPQPDNNHLVQALKNGDLPGVMAQLEAHFDARNSDYINCERLMAKLLRQNADNSYGDLLSVVSDKFISSYADEPTWLRDFGNWSHALCHLFEKYGSDGATSFLDLPHQYPVATRLLDAMVSNAIEAHSIRCVDRTLEGLLKLNIKDIRPDSLKDAFYFKPESLSTNGFTKMMNGVLGAFCESATPYEFFQKILPVGNPSKYSTTLWPVEVEPEIVAALLEEFHDIIPAEIMSQYLNDFPELSGRTQTVEELLLNIRHSVTAASVESGIFVDVDGTLISSDSAWDDRLQKRIEKPALNGPLVSALLEKIECGVKVTVFTGGDPELASRSLRILGCPERLLAVRAKEEFRGKLLELVIDDTTPGYQGFGAVSYLSAYETSSEGALVKEGEQWRFERGERE